jgi:hypothetical protein
MHRKSLLVSVVVLIVALSMAAVKCPICGSNSYFTGYTKTDLSTGKLLKEYQCMKFADHKFWLP